MRALAWISIALLTTCSAALSKSPAEAISDMGNVSDVDPNGVKWMFLCIGLLFTVAISLITATVIYYNKSRKKNGQ